MAWRKKLKIPVLKVILLLTAMVLLTGQLKADNLFTGDYFNLEYPEQWQSVEEEPQGMILEFVMLAPEEIIANEFTTNVNIMAEEMQQDIAAEEYADMVLMQVENMLTDFEIDSEENIDIDGRTGVDLVYSGIAEEEAGDFELTWRQAIVIEEGVAYIVTLTAEREVYDEFTAVFDSIIESMEIL